MNEEKREKVRVWLQENNDYRPFNADGCNIESVTFENNRYSMECTLEGYLTEEEAEKLYDDYQGEHGGIEYHDAEGRKNV